MTCGEVQGLENVMVVAYLNVLNVAHGRWLEKNAFFILSFEYKRPFPTGE
jgi:hypothetical protein